MNIVLRPKLELSHEVWDGFVYTATVPGRAVLRARRGRSLLVVNVLRFGLFAASAALLVGLFGRHLSPVLIAGGLVGSIAALALTALYGRVRVFELDRAGWRLASRALGLAWDKREGPLDDFEGLVVAASADGADVSVRARSGLHLIDAATSRNAAETAVERVEAVAASLRT